MIDYKKERFERVAKEVDLVFDTLGGETQERSWSVLKPGGSLISTLTEPSKEEAARRNARSMRFTARESGEQLREIGAHIGMNTFTGTL